MQSEELCPSELGTKEYWDNCYKQELENFSSHGDEGEEWFGHDSAQRVVRWIDNYMPKDCCLIDIGCGNGQLLIMLWEKGYAKLTGVDYSLAAIEMAEKVINSHGACGITLKEMDITNVGKEMEGLFDVVHDKGTYDAISLSSEGQKMRASYLDGICKLYKRNTNCYLIITSCNWTGDELTRHFENEFDFVEELPTPKFHFGGKQGSTISSVIFKRKR